MDNGSTLNNVTATGTITFSDPANSSAALTLNRMVFGSEYCWRFHSTGGFEVYCDGALNYSMGKFSDFFFRNGGFCFFQDQKNSDSLGVLMGIPPNSPGYPGESTNYTAGIMSSGDSFIWGDTGACVVGDKTSPYTGDCTGAKLVAFKHNNTDYLHNYSRNDDNAAERARVSVRTYPDSNGTLDAESQSDMTTLDQNNVAGTVFNGSTIGPTSAGNIKTLQR